MVGRPKGKLKLFLCNIYSLYLSVVALTNRDCIAYSYRLYFKWLKRLHPFEENLNVNYFVQCLLLFLLRKNRSCIFLDLPIVQLCTELIITFALFDLCTVFVFSKLQMYVLFYNVYVWYSNVFLCLCRHTYIQAHDQNPFRST